MNECTGISANWCPIHGDCTCPVSSDPDCNILADKNDDNCPLHSAASTHGMDYFHDETQPDHIVSADYSLRRGPPKIMDGNRVYFYDVVRK
jgi:hypothetical protein